MSKKVEIKKVIKNNTGFIIDYSDVTRSMLNAVITVNKGEATPDVALFAEGVSYRIDGGKWNSLIGQDVPKEVWTYVYKNWGFKPNERLPEAKAPKKSVGGPNRLFVVAIWDHKIRAIFDGEAKVSELPHGEAVELHKYWGKSKKGVLRKAAEDLFVQMSEELADNK